MTEQPTIGASVHYFPPAGTFHQFSGPCAAVVVGHYDSRTVNLVFWGPLSGEFRCARVPYSPTGEAQTWRWPGEPSP